MPKIINNNQKKDFMKFRDEGLSFEKIARKIGISKPTALKLGKRYESGELQAELANLDPLEKILKEFIDLGMNEVKVEGAFKELKPNQQVSALLDALKQYAKLRSTNSKGKDNDSLDDLLAELEAESSVE